ncbi:MAG: hypothetical protein M4D80_35020 [Myxococcota bacterium]|nr:hypothetical protein [Myxococcota bacterium]
MRAYLAVLALLVSACGEDEPPPPAKTPGSPGAPKPGANATTGKGKQITPMNRVEDRVACPAPSDAKKCDPKVPLCAAGQYCIPAGNDHYCGACPERDAIRHTFKPRDFQGVDIRDPFQSFVIVPAGLGMGPEGKVPTEATPKCTRKEQFVATSANYQALKIIGIVSQGTQRKVLLSDGRVGHIVKRGDCVGKEKAVVKDIGAGYITFAVEAAGKSDPIEVSMQLYPSQVQLGSPDAIDPGAASTPMIAPPSGAAPAPQPAPEGPTTTIIQQKGTTTTTPNVPPPPQAPVQLKP